MQNTILEELKQKGVIKNYSYNNVDENGFVGACSAMRNSEQLVIVFNSGEMLGIDSICSGSLEDTSLTFSK